ncbi:hypothetical protein LOTGIDRAFT_155701 [Lottia gigantea]|uniref:Glycosyltransferase family 92 protein n=1 Tax=Lottia gigantea TaxID=225164 RepID=V3YX86_LOTGI|nr:hypothetical protein LOTGIDRAFT_155701 [Lottia gigantea]ESO82683.1 hypothetical protein LOTGIDRAFT_155701 [Lottia gigantea]
MRIHLRRIVLLVSIINTIFVLVYFFKSQTISLSVDGEQSHPRERVLTVGLRPQIPVPRDNLRNIGSTLKYIERKSGSCQNEIERPINVEDTETWQKVGGKTNTYVFSAFFDGVNNPVIRILALTERGSSQGLFCQLWYNDTKEELRVIAPIKKHIPEDHSKRYAATIYLCNLMTKEIPYAVSLTSARCQRPTNLLPINNQMQKEFQFSLCLTPFSIRYSRAYELVEMIELNRILGVDKFIFYNYSTGVNVDEVLKHYTSKGIVKVIQWHLPVRVNQWPQNHKEEVHYFGQLASLNDCLYRNLYSSEHLVYTDLDEFIVPRNADNYKELIRKLDTRPLSNGAFIFRCVFFRKEWPQIKGDFKGRKEAEKFKSITLLTTSREKRIWPTYQRSKYIVKPKGVEVVGIHNIWSYRSGYSSLPIDSSNARLHHYRSWENPNDQQERQEDFIIHEKYKDRLIEQLKLTWRKLPNVVLNIPIQNYTFPL